MTEFENQLIQRIEKLEKEIRQPFRLIDIEGKFETVTSVPTHTPAKMQAQVLIYTDNLTTPTIKRLYIYSTQLKAWIVFPNGLAGTKVYYVSDTSEGTVNRKLTFLNGVLISET